MGQRWRLRLYGENRQGLLARGCTAQKVGAPRSLGASLWRGGPLAGLLPSRVSLPSCHRCGQRSVLRVGRWGGGSEREEGNRRHPALRSQVPHGHTQVTMTQLISRKTARQVKINPVQPGGLCRERVTASEGAGGSQGRLPVGGELWAERETCCAPGKGSSQPWAAGSIPVPLPPANRLVVKCGLPQLAVSALRPPRVPEAWPAPS